MEKSAHVLLGLLEDALKRLHLGNAIIPGNPVLVFLRCTDGEEAGGGAWKSTILKTGRTRGHGQWIVWL